jgi:hypothetical protein
VESGATTRVTAAALATYITGTVVASSVPGGSNTQVQFNNSGSFGGSANVTWDGTDFNLGATTSTYTNLNFGGIPTITRFTGGQANLSLIILPSNPTNDPNFTYVCTGSSGGTLKLMGGVNTRGGQIDICGGFAPSNPSCLLFRTGTGGSGGEQPERMRINSDGLLCINRTSALSNSGTDAYLSVYGEVPAIFYHSSIYDNVAASMRSDRAGSGFAGTFMNFQKGNATPIGSITFNDAATTTSYNTSSDYRLKENVQAMTGALAKVQQLRPCTYKWKANGADGEGFIAHELAEVCPHAVFGEKDAAETYTDEDGNQQTRPKYQGIDTSFLVATLTAAIQELKAEFDAYRAAHP